MEAKNALTEKIREELKLAADTGTVNASAIARTVFNKYPDLVDEYGEQAIMSMLTGIVRKEVKRWSAVATSPKIQPNLPGIDPDVLEDIPSAVFVPGETTDEDDGFEGSYRMLTGRNPVKHWEMRIAIEFLWKGVRADTKKARALEELLKYSKSIGRGNDDSVI